MKVFVLVFVAVIMFVGNALVTIVSIGGSMVAGSQASAFSGHGRAYGFYVSIYIVQFLWILILIVIREY
jgi:hypothetical protein